MARLANGDRSVFRSVFAALWPPLHAFCRRRLESEADADDAAQAAMEKVFSEASRYDHGRPALSWALAIAAWECRSLRRRYQRRREDDVAGAAEVPDGALTPEEESEMRELHDAASHVLGELSIADRDVLLASFSEEARERLTGAGPAVRKRRERALGRLRDAWRKLHGP